jgi:hypothetical protein
MYIGGLEVEVFDAKYVFLHYGTNETRHKWVSELNSLKASIFQGQLAYGEFDSFFKLSPRSEVHPWPSEAYFVQSFITYKPLNFKCLMYNVN